MKLDGRRESSNVEDRRSGGGFSSGSGSRMSTGKKGGCITIIVAIVGLFIGMKTGNWGLFQSANSCSLRASIPTSSRSRSRSRDS